MKRTSQAAKKRTARSFSASDRPLHKIAKLKRANEPPKYESKSLVERSAKTAKARTARLNKITGALLDSDA